MYYNILPHRYNGVRESYKYNLVDAELTALEILTINKIEELKQKLEGNSTELTLADIVITKNLL
jgi:hypothetical protein